jgi:histidine ammonia-lyase
MPARSASRPSRRFPPLWVENRRLADPVSHDTIPLAGDIEDTATNAAAAATNFGKRSTTSTAISA